MMNPRVTVVRKMRRADQRRRRATSTPSSSRSPHARPSRSVSTPTQPAKSQGFWSSLSFEVQAFTIFYVPVAFALIWWVASLVPEAPYDQVHEGRTWAAVGLAVAAFIGWLIGAIVIDGHARKSR